MKKKLLCKQDKLIDWVLILSGVVAVTAVSIYYSSTWYVYLSTLIGLLYIFTQAKAQVITQFLGILYVIMYSYVSFRQRLFGEVFLYVFIMLPMFTYGLIHWFRNRSRQKHIVLIRSNLKALEWLALFIFALGVSIGMYFLLTYLQASEIILSSLSFLSLIPAVYLLIRRCKWNQIVFLINDLTVLVMWLIMISRGNYSLMPIMVYHIFEMIYDIYGLYNWFSIETSQKLYDN